ncbi:MAG: response regulator [Nitrospiraceae bacterium]|nr:MAG: response regulator [Nitrospiraceae bacterium]
MSKKIIIADDNSFVLMYTGILLKRFEFQALPVKSGVEVLQQIALKGADAIMLDVHMQTMDGISVLRHLKDDKKTVDIPVIMISVDKSAETVNVCRELGCFDYLFKPIKIEMLHEVLQKCFYGKKGTDRKYIRVPFNKRAVVTYEGKSHELFVENISEGGIYVRKHEPLPVGSKVDIVISLEGGALVRSKGVVVHVNDLFGDFLKMSPGMAIQFSELGKQESEAFNQYVQKAIAKDLLEEQEEEVIEQ